MAQAPPGQGMTEQDRVRGAYPPGHPYRDTRVTGRLYLPSDMTDDYKRAQQIASTPTFVSNVDILQRAGAGLTQDARTNGALVGTGVGILAVLAGWMYGNQLMQSAISATVRVVTQSTTSIVSGAVVHGAKTATVGALGTAVLYFLGVPLGPVGLAAAAPRRRASSPPTEVLAALCRARDATWTARCCSAR